jgi:hypothetical protein
VTQNLNSQHATWSDFKNDGYRSHPIERIV